MRAPHGRAPAIGRDVPIDVQHAEPRWFGVGPPVFVFGVAVALVALGIVLIATGALVLGVVALLLAVALVPSFLAGARRWPDTRLARAGVVAADRAATKRASSQARSRRGPGPGDVVRIRREQFRLQRQRDARIRELGAAVYAEDDRAEELKAAAKALDERIDRNERELARTIAGARRTVRRERASVVTTQIVEPEDTQKP